VNLEADLLAKYAERLLADRLKGAETSAGEGDLSAGWLAEHGWGS
jgi:hypothetical protein